MQSIAAPGEVASSPSAGRPANRTLITGAETAAWLCALPCGALAALAIWLLAPPLARILYPAGNPFTFLAYYKTAVRPEHSEQMRYLLSLGAPILLSLATLALVRRAPRPPRLLAAAGVQVAQAATAIFVLACIVAQYRLRYGSVYTRDPHQVISQRYFTPPTLVVAALIAAATILAIRNDRVRETARGWLPDTRGRRLGALAIGVVMTLVWMLHAVNSDESIARSVEAVSYHVAFHLDETFAVINGRTPLVDFTSQYGSLWPYVVALAMSAFGKTLLVFSITMCAITASALLAVFGVLRRAAGSSAAALVLYLPFVATSMFLIAGTATNRYTFGSYFATFPLRYAGPYFVAWLTARRLERGEQCPIWPIFLASGLAMLNNVDYGVPAFGATVGALLWTAGRPSAASLRHLGVQIVAGVIGALALVSALTLIRAGSLPELHRLIEFARLYTVGGFADMPMPGVLGLHLLIYLTYVAAIATGTVLAASRDVNRVLTGMLVWVGIFGLGSASYYVGRSHPESLVATFSVWALSLALLAIVVVRALASRPRARPSIAAVLVLAGVGVAACSLAQTPLPWSQIDRIHRPFTEFGHESLYTRPLVPPQESDVKTFISSLAYGPKRFVVKAGAPVALFMAVGHRVADAYGIEDVVPFTGPESIETVQQLDETIDALRSAGGNTVIMDTEGGIDPQVYELMVKRGFMVLTTAGLRGPDQVGQVKGVTGVQWFGGILLKWVDMRHLYPRALR